MDENKKDWQIIKQIDVGPWKSGYIVKDEAGELRLMVVVERGNFLDNGGPNFQAEVEFMQRNNPARLTNEYLDEFHKKESETFLMRMKKYAAISHPRLATIKEITKDEKDNPIAFLECFFGSSITKALKDVSPNAQLAHFRQLFEALDIIHKNEMLVVKWSPNYIRTNIMAGETKFMSLWQIHTKEEVEAGSYEFDPLYATKRVIMGEKPAEYDDLYAVGLMMLEVYEGKPIFQNYRKGKDIETIKKSIKEGMDAICINKQILVPREYLQFVYRILGIGRYLDKPLKSAAEAVNIIADEFPEACKDAKELYAGVMTTMKL